MIITRPVFDHELSAISWTDSTFNPWEGCTKVCPACLHCYAETRDKRHMIEPVDHWGPGAPRRLTGPDTWRKARRWDRQANRFVQCGACGRREKRRHDGIGLTCCTTPGCLALPETEAIHTKRRVFTGSLCDVFDEEVSVEWFTDWLLLVLSCTNLIWLVLTKRPQNWRSRLEAARVRADQLADAPPKPNESERRFFAEREKYAALSLMISFWLAGDPPDNVAMGTTIGDQVRIGRLELLRAIPARWRFLSCEPLLSHLRFPSLEGIAWVIGGGESDPGGNARPTHPAWGRSLRDQAKAAGLPFHWKQWGEWGPSPAECIRGVHTGGGIYLLENGRFGNQGDWWDGRAAAMDMVGKKAAGNLLDGRAWLEFPDFDAEP